MVQGFAIGPDGTFYITSNTPGKVSHQLDAIVRGALDPSLRLLPDVSLDEIPVWLEIQGEVPSI